jgi:hypothetical protein
MVNFVIFHATGVSNGEIENPDRVMNPVSGFEFNILITRPKGMPVA